jgi:REP element-mobilizing transposase RayT
VEYTDRPNEALAYLITFRCYGTWLHGDPRGSTNRWHNVFGTDYLAPQPALAEAERRLLRGPVQSLDSSRRDIVARAVRDECDFREWVLLSANVRTNHVHAVVGAPLVRPERVLMLLKKRATRLLREAGLAGAQERLWSAGGSTVYLWRQRDVDEACRYVIEGQGSELD